MHKELDCYIVKVFKKTELNQYHKESEENFPDLELALAYAETHEAEGKITSIQEVYNIIR